MFSGVIIQDEHMWTISKIVLGDGKVNGDRNNQKYLVYCAS